MNVQLNQRINLVGRLSVPITNGGNSGGVQTAEKLLNVSAIKNSVIETEYKEVQNA